MSVKSGSMSKKTVAVSVKKMYLSKKEQMDLLMSQPQDPISDGEDSSSMSSVEGIGELVTKTMDKDKKQQMNKKKVELIATMPEESSDDDDDDHFGV